MKHGFYLSCFGYDCFMETDRKYITDALAKEFVKKLETALNLIPLDDKTIARLKQRIRPATVELHKIESGPFEGKMWLEFAGANFSYGTDASANPFADCFIFITTPWEE